MRSLLLLIFISLIALLPYKIVAQDTITAKNSLSSRNPRLNWLIASESVVGATCLTGLYSLWYSRYPRSSFHLINDIKEWRGMDKCGHTMTSYYMGKLGYESLKWGGSNQKSAIWYGGFYGFAYLGCVEFFDGLSKEWGASPGDLAANTLGTALFIGQQLAWNDQKIILKWSFHLSDMAQYNHNQMGQSVVERMLKDYNGQTYWLSVNLKGICNDDRLFPPWLNIALGYGADGMTGASTNPSEINGNPIPYFKRYSQFYISPDIDLSHIKTRSKTLKLVLNAVGFIKFPMPALEWSQNKLKAHLLYF